jgi:hypothetical protein
MTKENFNLRNVAAIVACLAITIFTGCEKIEPDDPNNPSGDDSEYYDPADDALDIALRNAKINLSYQRIDNDPYDDDCDEIVHVEAMACKGRLYVHGIHWADDFCDEGYNNYEIVVFAPPSIKCYSLDDHEWFGHNYADFHHNPKIAGSLGPEQDRAIEQYYRDDRTENYWDTPYVYSIGGYTETTWRTVEETRTIAGIQCTGYAIRKRYQQGNIDVELVSHKVWYDPTTNVTMRYEEYDASSYYLENHLDYWVQIDEIEYGKVKQADIDALLNDYLSTHNPTDISDHEEPGSGW